ncbi:glutaminyl-peptide cyclotransferase [Fibrobacter sp.]
MPSKFSFVYRLSSIVIFLSSLAFAEAPRVLPAILDSIPHEPTHFTQGLFFNGKDLIETTGQYGESGLYRRTLDGKILDSARLAPRYFGEGSIAVGEDIFYLTWKAKKAFIYSRKPFKYKGEFRIPTEGWGLTYWQNALLMSNGSDELLQIALGGFYVVGSIRVTDAGKPVKNLNELEIVGNTLYANVWQTALIAVIDLPSGKVQKYIDFSAKGREIYRNNPNIDVLNGIAYDGKYLWVTGKYWPQIYKIAVP